MDQLTLLIQSILYTSFKNLYYSLMLAMQNLNDLKLYPIKLQFISLLLNSLTNLGTYVLLQYIVKMAIGLVQSKNMYCYRREGPPIVVIN